jgi:hypothetical protein
MPSGVQLQSAVTTSFYTTFAIGTDSTVYVWGNNNEDFGNGSTATTSTVPESVALPNGAFAVSLAAASAVNSTVPSVYVVGTDGNLYEWGQSEYGEFGNGQTGTQFLSTPTANPWLSEVQGVAAAPSLMLADAVFTAPYTLTGRDATATAGVAGTLDVGYLAPGVGSTTTPGTFATTIDWGDGSADSVATLVPHNGGYQVEAAHTFSAAGGFDVTVSANGENYAATTTSTVTVSAGPTPTIASVTPGAIGQGATKKVSVTGTHFVVGATSVSFSSAGLTVGPVTVASSTKLTFQLKAAHAAAVGPSSLTVTTTAGGPGTCTTCFTVDAAPKITAVRGALVPGSPTTLTVKGSGFESGLTVTTSIDGATVGSVTSLTSTQFQVSVTAPVGTAPGAYTLTVTNPDGGRVNVAKLVVS